MCSLYGMPLVGTYSLTPKPAEASPDNQVSIAVVLNLLMLAAWLR
jgi:hypothetical protein